MAVTLTAGVGTAPGVANATDVAGSFTITPNGGAATGVLCTLNFDYPYANIGAGLSACQVILTPTNLAAATDMTKVYISSTTTGTCAVSCLASCANSVHTYNYHIIETQSGNGAPTFSNFTYGGTPAYLSATASQGTDVAGRIGFDNKVTAGSVTCAFGYAYAVAPIVVLTAYHNNTAANIGFIWATSTTNDFTINYRAGAVVGSNIIAYHIIETQ